MPAVKVNGTQLEYREQGQGEPVVLVHGTLGDLRSWNPQIDAFAEHYRVITYSRRYHHPNQCDGNESDYSAASHAEDLAAFIRSLGIESAHIVGNSYGAYTALFLAARHPEQVRAVVFGEPPVFPLLDRTPEGREVRDDFLEKIWRPAGERLRNGKLKEGVRHFVDGVIGDGTFDQFPDEVEKLLMDNVCEFKAETASPEFWTPFTCEEARQIQAPALLLTGEHSLRMFALIVSELDQCLPNNEWVTLPDCTHEMPGDNPEAYNETVLHFLNNHSA